MSKSSMLLGNDIPFVEAAHVGERQRPTAIMLRTSFTTGDKGAALGIAQAWHNRNNRVDSCHYVVDEATIFRCVPDKVIARRPVIYKNAIVINVCYDPPEWPVTEVTLRTAHLVARLCRLHKIDIRILNDVDESRWMKHKWRSRGGIILKTVGDFPVDEFFSSVKQNTESFNRRM